MEGVATKLLYRATLKSPLQYSTLIVCFEAVARDLDDVSNDRLRCADVSGTK